jgi:hypothetical protein
MKNKTLVSLLRLLFVSMKKCLGHCLADSRFRLFESFHFVGNGREVMNEDMDLKRGSDVKKSCR